MRILIATRNRGIIGGIENYLHSLIPAFLSRGHEVGLLYEHAAESERAMIEPPQANLPVWKGFEAETGATLEAWKPTVVYVQGLDSVELEAWLLQRYPAVLFVHNYYGTCTTGRKCHAFPGFRPCSRRFGAACLLLHYPRRCGGLNPVTTLRLFSEQKRRNALLPRYDGVLAGSRHMYEEFLRNGVQADRLHLVPLPATGMEPRNEPPPRKPSGGSVLLAGRLTDIKGGDYLVRALPLAMRELGRDLRLVIAGAGPEESNLRSQAGRLGVNAQFHGWMDSARLAQLMREVDLLAVPSLWPEPFGLVGLEAGCVGLPAVGYDAGGIRQWLTPSESGEIASADPPTPDGLAGAIVRALRDPEHYARLSTGAWRMAQQFTLAKHLGILEPILEEAICNGSAAA